MTPRLRPLLAAVIAALVAGAAGGAEPGFGSKGSRDDRDAGQAEAFDPSGEATAPERGSRKARSEHADRVVDAEDQRGAQTPALLADEGEAEERGQGAEGKGRDRREKVGRGRPGGKGAIGDQPAASASGTPETDAGPTEAGGPPDAVPAPAPSAPAPSAPVPAPPPAAVPGAASPGAAPQRRAARRSAGGQRAGVREPRPRRGNAGRFARVGAGRPPLATVLDATAVAPAVPAVRSAPAAPPDEGRSLRNAAPTRSPPPAAAPQRRDTVTRTVVRVLSAVPEEVRIALAGLALLGLVLGAVAAAQTWRSRRLERARRGLLADIGLLQSALLPDLPPRIGAARVSSAYRPADGLAAGGDFFDAFPVGGGRTAVVVGDVAGHGRDVVPLTAAVRYGMRAYLEAGLSPRAALGVAGGTLAAQLGGRQVTVAVGVHDPADGCLTYACAGHWPPLLPGSGVAALITGSSPPLGAGVATGRRQSVVPMPPGTAACFFTDGLLDVVRDGERLGPAGLLAEAEALGARLSADRLLARLVAASERQPDDMAACVLQPLAGAAPGARRIELLEVDGAAVGSGRARRFLRACGAGDAAVTAALADARSVLRRAGTAVLEAVIDEDGCRVAVRPPDAVSLRASAPAGRAASVA